MRLILSTSNIMHSAPPVISRPFTKSNAELTQSLKSSISTASKQNPTSWTSTEIIDNIETLYIPTPHPTPLSEDRSAYDITVKLFHLPHAPIEQRPQHVKDAVHAVLKQLQVDSVDLAIVSFPHITFDADDEDTESDEQPTPTSTSEPEHQQHSSPNSLPNGHTTLPLSSPTSIPSTSTSLETILPTYGALETLHASHTIGKLGLAEFSHHRLARLLPSVRIRPSVDQLNLRDCCVVPRLLIMFAKQQGIELLTHNDCTDILPGGTIRELLTPAVLQPRKEGGKEGEERVGRAALAAGDEKEKEKEGLQGEVTPLWVIKWTAVVKNRGVVESKGYIAAAELVPSF